jgi:hypothetical protein
VDQGQRGPLGAHEPGAGQDEDASGPVASPGYSWCRNEDTVVGDFGGVVPEPMSVEEVPTVGLGERTQQFGVHGRLLGQIASIDEGCDRSTGMPGAREGAVTAVSSGAGGA